MSIGPADGVGKSPKKSDLTLSFGNNGESFKMSIFNQGFAINDVWGGLFKDYDSDGNGVIEAEELQNLQSAVLNAAGDDKILDENELAKLFSGSEKITESSEKNSALFKAFLICLKNGIGNTEIYGNDYMKIISSFNKDGSGVKVSFFDEIDGYRVEIYSKGKTKKELVTSTNTDCREGGDFGRTRNNMTSHVVYDDNGNVIEQSCIYRGDNLTKPYSEHSVYEYDKKGNLITKLDKYNDIESGYSSYTKTDYDKNGDISQKTIISNHDGFNQTEVTDYDGEKVIRKQLRQEKEDIILVEEYDGANIENRFGYLPSRRTVIDKSTGETKTVITNKFDSDGILISRTVEDKSDNSVKKYDYSESDGIIDTSQQGGIGNCFYLETINTLNTTKQGKKIINSMIEKSDDGSFKVKFPGAPKIIEDLNNGVRNFPSDKIFIKPEYEITEKEFKEACLKAGIDYSTGDKDVLLLELAYAKYRKDVVATAKANDESLSLFSDTSQLISGLDVARGWDVKQEDMGAGGVLGVTMYLFTGEKSDVYFSPENKHYVCNIDSDGNLNLDESNETSWNPTLKNNESNVFNERYDDIDEVSEKLLKDTDIKDGTFKNYMVEVSLPLDGEQHAFTVKGIKDDKVILINPWDSSKEVSMNFDDFKKSACMINILKL